MQDTQVKDAVDHARTAAQELHKAISDAAAKRGLHLALAELPVAFFPAMSATAARDAETVTALRSVLMKPEHLDWVGRIWEILSEVAGQDLPQTKGSSIAAV